MSATTETPGGLAVELNGINVIAESERKGQPHDLFWPWCAANISVLAVSYGSFVLGFGVSFWQATIAGRRRGRAVLRALRGRGSRRQARLGADDGAQPGGFRRDRQRAARRSVLGAARRLGDGARLVVDPGDRDGVRPSSAGAAGTSPRSSRSSSRPRWSSAPVCSASTSSCGCRPSSRSLTIVLTVGFVGLTLDDVDLGQGVEHAVGQHPGVHRRAGPRGHRFRRRLGQHRRRLLALPAADVVQPGRVRLDDVRRRGGPGGPHGVRHPAGRLEQGALRRDPATTRSAP